MPAIQTDGLRPVATITRTATVCACGEVNHDGTCLNVGTCERADTAATRGAARTTAKFPAAWAGSGQVD